MTTPLLYPNTRLIYRVIDKTTKQHSYSNTLLESRRRAGEWFENRGRMPGTLRASPEKLSVELLDLGSMSVLREWDITPDLRLTALDTSHQPA